MSDKALFVMDMPENGCADCFICRESFLKSICGITGNGISGNHERGGFPEECPLKPVPRKKECDLLSLGNKIRIWKEGWNACIDKILEGCNFA